MNRVSVIDTHTGGEPTRIVVAGGPDLGRGSMDERRQRFREQFDEFRSAVVNEPRGSDVMVGALLVEPVDPASAAGVIFFNNVGYLGMCGHGTIGVAVALGYMGRITAGRHRFETPVGNVEVEYDGANSVSFENVPSYRYKSEVEITGLKKHKLVGDIAWGGNWFYIATQFGPRPDCNDLDFYIQSAKFVRKELKTKRIAGEDGGEIDHVEFELPPRDLRNHSRNFVVCPGYAYDRSPCGTGTSAKIACLAADGKLKEGEIWRQESIVGSVFEASYRRVAGSGDPATTSGDPATTSGDPATTSGNRPTTSGDSATPWIIPKIRGTAYVTAETTLILDPRDPFVRGIRP